MIFRQLFDSESSTYTYLIADENTRDAAIIDPVTEQFSRDTKILNELALCLRYSLETHVHADHITSASLLREATHCEIVVPDGSGVKGADLYIKDNATLQLGSITLKALSTPGHVESHMAYLINGTHVLTGDALFIRGCGRTDFQGGSAATLYQVVTQRLFSLPDTVFVYPGHDYQGQTCTTIGEEKQFNPRFAKHDQQGFETLMAGLNLPPPKKIALAVPANLQCGKKE